MTEQTIEQRMSVCEVRALRNDERKVTTLEGRPIVFDQRTDLADADWDEIIDKGALDNADLKDVRFLVNHDTNQLPLARSRNNNANSTMRISVDDAGMLVEADIDTDNNPRGQELASAVSRGDVSGMSFMFTINGDAWENLDADRPTRHITSISRVYEVSAVTFPAYEQTSINVRSLESGRASLESARKALESARRRSERIRELNQKLEDLNDKGIH